MTFLNITKQKQFIYVKELNTENNEDEDLFIINYLCS